VSGVYFHVWAWVNERLGAKDGKRNSGKVLVSDDGDWIKEHGSFGILDPILGTCLGDGEREKNG